MKIHPVGAESFHVDRQANGQTDMLKLRVAFCNFANVPKERWEGGLVSIDIHNFGTKWKQQSATSSFCTSLYQLGRRLMTATEMTKIPCPNWEIEPGHPNYL
jgi:hypothetical protein